MILPKKMDVMKAKADERRREIDEGVILAKRVDELRRMRLDMERSFEEWRIGTSKAVQAEIDALVSIREALKEEISELSAKKQKNASI